MQNSINDKSLLSQNNKKLIYDGRTMLKVLQELNMIVVSLDKMGSYYGINGNQREYEEETCNFIDNSWIAPRLSKIRTYLSSAFSEEVGEDDMDDLGRACEKLSYWEKPGDVISHEWLDN